MQTASFVGFLRTILIIIFVYYVLKFLVRLLMPILLRKMVRKAEENFKQHTNQQQQEPTNTSKTKFENPKSKKELGEYIDYEEVD
jgi:flagellar biosynthesis/type III secretory pathway M-ring protein FliF/YscJ